LPPHARDFTYAQRVSKAPANARHLGANGCRPASAPGSTRPCRAHAGVSSQPPAWGDGGPNTIPATPGRINRFRSISRSCGFRASSALAGPEATTSAESRRPERGRGRRALTRRRSRTSSLVTLPPRTWNRPAPFDPICRDVDHGQESRKRQRVHCLRQQRRHTRTPLQSVGDLCERSGNRIARHGRVEAPCMVCAAVCPRLLEQA
jgi:hypothetical protein